MPSSFEATQPSAAPITAPIAAPAPAPTPAPVRRRAQPLDAAQEAELAQGLASAPDGPLKAALLALGRNVLKRNRPA